MASFQTEKQQVEWTRSSH